MMVAVKNCQQLQSVDFVAGREGANSWCKVWGKKSVMPVVFVAVAVITAILVILAAAAAAIAVEVVMSGVVSLTINTGF